MKLTLEDEKTMRVSGELLPNSEWLGMRVLAQHLIWMAPVGVKKLRGWMVCRRVMNNPDGPNTRVDFLRNPVCGRAGWKKPFRENEHLFPGLDAAFAAALAATKPGGGKL
jgi:hypothetical protein